MATTPSKKSVRKLKKSAEETAERAEKLAARARTGAALASGAPGERLHLAGVEGAAPATGHPAAAELAAAHVRVHRLGLHTEQLGGLLGAQPAFRSGGGGLLIVHGGHRIDSREY